MTTTTCAPFEPYGVADRALEYDMFLTPNCQPLMLRQVIILLWTALELLGATTAIFLFVREFFVTERQAKIVFFRFSTPQIALLLVSANHLARFAMFLMVYYGSTNYFRYFLYSATFYLAYAAVLFMLKVWIITFLRVRSLQLNMPATRLNNFFFGIAISFGLVIFTPWTAAYFYQHDMALHNLLLAIGYLTNSIFLIMWGCVTTWAGYNLIKVIIISPDFKQSSKLQKTRERIKRTSIIISIFIFGTSVSGFGMFIWYFVTLDSTLGMSGMFYVFYFAFLPAEFAICQSIAFFVRRIVNREASENSSSGPSNSTSNNNRGIEMKTGSHENSSSRTSTIALEEAESPSSSPPSHMLDLIFSIHFLKPKFLEHCAKLGGKEDDIAEFLFMIHGFRLDFNINQMKSTAINIVKRFLTPNDKGEMVLPVPADQLQRLNERLNSNYYRVDLFDEIGDELFNTYLMNVVWNWKDAALKLIMENSAGMNEAVRLRSEELKRSYGVVMKKKISSTTLSSA